MTDDDTSDEEVDPHLQTTPEQRQYGTVPGSVQATQAVLAHTRAQTNPTIEHGPPQHNSTSTQQHKDKTDKKPK